MSVQSNYCNASASNSNPAVPIAPLNRKLQKKQPLYDEQPFPSIEVPAKSAPSPLTWAHWAWVMAGCATLLFTLGKTFKAASSPRVWLEIALSALAGYVLADLVSGIYHWALDNYGSPSTPIIGTQIEDFLDHHKLPWVITKYPVVNNLHVQARVVVFSVLPIDLVYDDPTILAFVATLSGFIMFGAQFHAWAHGTKGNLPRAVVVLQDLGVLVSRTQHELHHRLPHNSNYCVVSGLWNKFLDKTKMFHAMEMVIFFLPGVKPRSWDENAVGG